MTLEELPQGFKDWKNQYACDDPSSPGYNIRDLYAAYSAGVQAERERCVRISEKTFKSTEAKYGMTWYLYHEDIAAAIKGRK
jgi:hypothetical protein